MSEFAFEMNIKKNLGCKEKMNVGCIFKRIYYF